MKSVAVTSRSFSKHPVLRSKLLKIYPDTKFNDDGKILYGNALVDFLRGYEKAIVALEIIDEAIIKHLPDLKVIGKYGVGLDTLDLAALHKNKIKLGWTGGVNKRSVAELVISSAISLLHKTVFSNSEVKSGRWYQVKGRQLSNCTVGIIGCGHIGKDVVELLQPYNCKIIVNDIRSFPEFYKKYNIIPSGLDELLSSSDVVTLHTPLDETTRNILNKEKLQLLKKDSILINLARGGLIDETELKNMILEKRIVGAALDVLEVEPPQDNDLVNLDNILVTPHVGGSTNEAILQMGLSAIDGLDNNKDAGEFIT